MCLYYVRSPSHFRHHYMMSVEKDEGFLSDILSDKLGSFCVLLESFLAAVFGGECSRLEMNVFRSWYTGWHISYRLKSHHNGKKIHLIGFPQRGQIEIS